MQVMWATDQGSPQRPNEDFVATAPGVAVVLDGCGLPLGTDLGCGHGTAWYARSLGTRLLARILDGQGPAQSRPPVGPPGDRYRQSPRPLVGRLAGAIADVAAAHSATCDLSVPTTPAATVLALRVREELVDYLLLDGPDGLRPITAAPPFAAADPDVAEAAITGTVPRAELRRVLLLTDGATRLVDTFGTTDWQGLADLVEHQGPTALIERTREIERTDPSATRWPRGKPHDDASIVLHSWPRPLT
jgi:hypothetical protein